MRVLEHYGGKPPRCRCCGVGQMEFLTLDHTRGGGNAARTIEGHKGGTAQYSRLIKNGLPHGYQVLCWNCNAASGIYGVCPHVAKR